MRYAILIEGEPGNYSAFVPDLPGCVAVGDTIEETMREMQEAIRFHIEGLQEDGLPVPEPTTVVEYVEL
jgi:predicted RNase H-like HicB family nuclease